MEIRLARPDDFKQIAKLLNQLNPDDPVLSTEQSGTCCEILNSDHLKLLVADDNNSLIGSCYLNIILNLTREARPYAVIENVITDAMHRNKGVGKMLITRAVDTAREADCYKVVLMTGRKDDSVHAFYKKCGFVADEKQAYILRVI